jgi:hypothetical protein
MMKDKGITLSSEELGDSGEPSFVTKFNASHIIRYDKPLATPSVTTNK